MYERYHGGKNKVEIILYITDEPNRVIGGNNLCINMKNDQERQEFIQMFADTFEASVMQMKNGDHLLFNK